MYVCGSTAVQLSAFMYCTVKHVAVIIKENSISLIPTKNISLSLFRHLKFFSD